MPHSYVLCRDISKIRRLLDRFRSSKRPLGANLSAALLDSSTNVFCLLFACSSSLSTLPPFPINTIVYANHSAVLFIVWWSFYRQHQKLRSMPVIQLHRLFQFFIIFSVEDFCVNLSIWKNPAYSLASFCTIINDLCIIRVTKINLH